MVGLYKDPDGKNIVLNTTTLTVEKESKTTSQSNGGDIEMNKLKMRITELENSLRQRVSVIWLPCVIAMLR